MQMSRLKAISFHSSLGFSLEKLLILQEVRGKLLIIEIPSFFTSDCFSGLLIILSLTIAQCETTAYETVKRCMQ